MTASASVLDVKNCSKNFSFSVRDFFRELGSAKDKREQIIAEAVQVFMENGYYKAKMEMIAQRVGIGKSTIYEYFSSKQQLFYEAIFYVQENFYRNLQSRISQEEDPEKQLKSVIVAYLTFCRVLSRLTEIVAHMDEFSGDVKENILQCWQQSTGLIEGVLQQGIEKGVFRPVDIHLMAQILTGTLLSAHVYFYTEKESLPKMIDEMYSFIQKGIKQGE